MQCCIRYHVALYLFPRYCTEPHISPLHRFQSPKLTLHTCDVPLQRDPIYMSINILRGELCSVVSWEMRALAPEADISNRDKWLHPTVNCGIQLLIPAWDTCFWHQSPYMTQINIIHTMQGHLTHIGPMTQFPQCQFILKPVENNSHESRRNYELWISNCYNELRDIGGIL